MRKLVLAVLVLLMVFASVPAVEAGGNCGIQNVQFVPAFTPSFSVTTFQTGVGVPFFAATPSNGFFLGGSFFNHSAVFEERVSTRGLLGRERVVERRIRR